MQANAKPNLSLPKPSAPDPALVGGRYVVNLSRPLPGAGGSLAAFAASDQNGGSTALMALQVRPHAPPRAGAIDALLGLGEPGILSPLACGPAPAADGRLACFVICRAPPGPALWPESAATVQPWSDAALVRQLLCPVATALVALTARRTTHRAIRPGNLFRGGATDPVVLGCAWASPPGLLQPAVFEPPYLAMCEPSSRGAGTVADDVYALGVTLLALATGRAPMAGLTDAEVIERKLDLGCFHALTEGASLSPLVTDLLSGLLANDPQHRPMPALLADPATVRGRRVATRPPRRAAQPLQVAGIAVWNARMLAYASAREPVAATRLLRLGVVDHWLRRALGEAVLAGRIEEAVRQRETDTAPGHAQADGWLMLRAVLTLDPLAPLCWQGVALWPDALGPALATAMADREAGEATRAKLGDIVAREVVAAWASARPEHCDAANLRLEARDHRSAAQDRGWAGGLARLCYVLNPLLPCRSPILAMAAAATLGTALTALEAAAGGAGQRPPLPLDQELGAFLGARLNGRADGELAALSDSLPPGEATLLQLRILALAQGQLSGAPLPRLAAWLLDAAAPLLGRWKGAAGRDVKQAQLAVLAVSGNLPRLLEAMDNAAELRADAAGWRQAAAAVQRIDDELARVALGGRRRADAGRLLGQEIAAGLALAALALASVAAGLG